MSNFQLSNTIDSDKVFLVNLSEIEGRLDPHPYHKERKETIKKLEKIQCKPLRSVVMSNKVTTTDIDENDIYIGLENIVSNSGEYIKTNEKTSISSAAIFKKGQILFPKLRPYLNKVHLALFNGLCSTEFHIYDVVGLIPKYLFIYLQSNLIVSQTKHLMTGNTLPRLQTEDINKLPVPILSDEKQLEIIKKYDKAFNDKQQKEAEAKNLLASIDDYLLKELGITLPEKNNSLKNRIFTTSIKDVSGGRFDPIFYSDNIQFLQKSKYQYKNLRECVTGFNSGFGIGKNEQDKNGDGIIQIRPTNIDNNGNLKFEKNILVPVEKVTDDNKLVYGDIIFNNTNSQDLVGKTAIFLSDIPVATYSNHITILKAKENLVNSFYLKELLNLFQHHKFFYSICTNWNNQSGIGNELLKKINIPLPPQKKQIELAQHISDIRAKAKQLEEEAKEILEKAKQEVEQIILGEK